MAMLLSVEMINGNGTFFWKKSGLFHKRLTAKIIAIKIKLSFQIKKGQQYAEHKTVMQYKKMWSAKILKKEGVHV